MRDLAHAVADTSVATFSGWNATAESSGRPNTGDARYAGRINELTHRWDAASRTASQRQWSAGRIGAKHGESGDEDAERALRSVGPARGALLPVRVRAGRAAPRHAVAPVTEAAPEETAGHRDVIAEPMPPRWEVRKHYTLVQTFRALSSCASPFAHASQIASDLFAVSTYPHYTQPQRDALQVTAVVTDQLAGLSPHVFLLQSVCKVFGFIADLLDDKMLSAGDLLDMSMLSRHLMTLKRIRAPLYVKPKILPPRRRRPATAPVHAHAATKPQSQPAVEPGAAGLDGQYAGAKASAPRVPDVSRLQESDERAITSLTFIYSEPAETDLHSPAVDAEGDSRGPAVGGAQDTAEEDFVAARARESIGAEAEREWAAMRRIASGIPAAQTQWAYVQSVPLRRRPGPLAQWATVPVSEYGVPGVDVTGRASGERFSDKGRDYLHLDGHALALRELLPGDPWIVDNRAYPYQAGTASDRLPPLPMWKNSDGWTPQEPLLRDVPEVHRAVVSEDGYIRYRDRKFIQVDGARVEVARQGIDGELSLYPLAQSLPDNVSAADSLQIMHSPDGRHWIEGAQGYYPLRFDLALGEFYVVDKRGWPEHRTLLDFDPWRQRWAAGVERRVSGYAEVLATRYGEDDVERAVTDNEASIDSLPSSEDGARADGNVAEDVFAYQDAHTAESDDRAQASRPTPPFPPYVTQATGLEREFGLFGHYGLYIKNFPFLTSDKIPWGASPRRKLRHGLRDAFYAMEFTSVVPANRMDKALREGLAPTVLNFRKSLRGLYPSAAKWHRMTLPEKQYEVGLMIDLAYRKSENDMWPCLVGYCNEIADVMLHALGNSRHGLRNNVLQLALQNQAGVKGTHVVLIYVDDPAALALFGDLTLRDVRFQRSRPTISDTEFYAWLLRHRDSVLLIDAWATNKLLDISAAESIDAVRTQLSPTLLEAGFHMTGLQSQFTVRAVLPERPQSATRGRREQPRPRAIHSVAATWEVLADWALTGALPTFVSPRALRGDLCAAAEQPGVPPRRRALLRTLASEIGAAGRNASAVVGVDRRLLTMAGFAALALMETPGGSTTDRGRDTTVQPDVSAMFDATSETTTSDANGGSEMAETIDTTRAMDSADAIDTNHSTNRTDTTHGVDSSDGITEVDAVAERNMTRVGEVAAHMPTIAALSAYQPASLPETNGSALVQAGLTTYLWMQDGRYYAVREILPGTVFIVDPDESPFGRPPLPPIPLERTGPIWRLAGRYG